MLLPIRIVFSLGPFYWEQETNARRAEAWAAVERTLNSRLQVSNFILFLQVMVQLKLVCEIYSY